MTTLVVQESANDPVGVELSETMSKDGRINGITSNVMPELTKALTDIMGGEKPAYLKPMEYKIQEDPCSDEKDTNFFVKFQVGENEFVHAKIAQDPSRRLSLCKLAKKAAEDEIDVI